MSVFKTLTSALVALSLMVSGFANAGVDPVQPDPNTGANFNRYAYANNNPYRYVDPDGRFGRDFDSISKDAETYLKTPPPSDKDWLGPAIGYSLIGIGAIAAAPVAAEVGMTVYTSPSTIAVGTDIAAGAAGVTGTAGLASLASRVSQVHSALHPIAANMRTTAGLQTAQGARIFGSGALSDLTPAQRSLLGAGEIAARAPGAHAEATVLGAAAQRGLTPASMEVSRTICPACQQLIESTGGRVVTPQRAEW
ncbi:hypothetical protein M2650_01680 [Luteimonas sp. SX5]|uniref:RHS repeat-associated core domain-containing protein n=1 Tax=Luteimonas galliterrae TaxID=2940486 RepID=A0ABT0MEQ2_9GAMM|nr:hypothetical protein [Luteimonas galliterrae]MCL1633357.1 hypothetical protein [Luteimonas galliterrae]